MVKEETATTTTESAIPTVDAPTPDYISGRTVHVITPALNENNQPTTTKLTQPSDILCMAVSKKAMAQLLLTVREL